MRRCLGLSATIIRLVMGTLLVRWFCADLTAEEPSGSELANWRRYRDGPLAADDFRGKVPTLRDPSSGDANGPLTAYTLTEIRYDLHFQVTGARNRWTARLVRADARAVVLRDQSWNLSPQDERLMDHEQGHFDLSHSFALAVQLYLDEHLKSRRLPVGAGTSSSAATRSLEDKLRAELKPILDEHTKAQSEYDRITGHGAITAAQGEQRKLQRAQIAELDGKLKAPKKKSGK